MAYGSGMKSGMSGMKKSMPKKSEPKKKMGKKDGDLSEAQMNKLKEHSKKHGGMSSRHMKMMVKLMKEGMSFSKAHNKTVEMEKGDKGKMEDKKESKGKGLTAGQKKLPKKLQEAILKKQNK